jgi:hypothetical protein
LKEKALFLRYNSLEKGSEQKKKKLLKSIPKTQTESNQKKTVHKKIVSPFGKQKHLNTSVNYFLTNKPMKNIRIANKEQS